MKKLLRVLIWGCMPAWVALFSPAAWGQISNEDILQEDGIAKWYIDKSQPQIPNFDMEVYQDDEKEPWGWNSSNTGDVYAVMAGNTLYQTIWAGTPRSGSVGIMSAKIISKKQKFVRFGITTWNPDMLNTGVLSTGQVYYKYNTKGYPYVRTYREKSAFCCPFSSKPDSIIFWAKSPGHSSFMSLYFHADGDFEDRCPDGISGAQVVAQTSKIINPGNDWVRYSVPINDYSGTPSYVLLSFMVGTSFKDMVESVAENSELFIDDVLFIYNNQTNLRSSENFKLNSIDKGSGGRYICNSSAPCSITLNYTLTGTMSPFNLAGGNDVIAQLSDRNGSFEHPRSLGSVKSNKSGSLTVPIPADITSSQNYRIRLISTDYPDTTNAIPLQIIREWKITTHIAKANKDGSITEDGKVYGRITPQYYTDKWGGGNVSSADGYHLDSNRLELTADDSHIPRTIFVGWYAAGHYVGNDKTLYVDMVSDTNITAVFDTLFTVTCEQVPGTRHDIFHLDNAYPPTLLSSLTVRKSADSTALVHFSVPEGFAFHGFWLNGDTVHTDDPAMKPFYNSLPDNYLYSFKVSADVLIKPLIDTLVYPQRFKVASYDNRNVANPNLGHITGIQNRYRHFDTLRVTAHAVNEFSHFKGWYDSAAGGDPITVDTLLKVFVGKPATYIAAFQEEMHKVGVSANYADRGTVQLFLDDHTVASPQTLSGVDENRIRITATAKKGYTFQYWEVNQVFPPEKGLAEVNTRWYKRDTAFVNGHIAADYTIKAVFDTSRHSLRINRRLQSLPDSQDYLGHSSGSVTGAKLYTGGKTGYKYGDSVMLTAKADSGYYFVRWDIASLPDSIKKRDTLWVQIFSDTTIKALFEVKTYRVEVTWNNGNLGNVTPTTSNNYRHFTPVRFVSHPQGPGELRYWVINGDTLSEDSTYTMTITDTAKVHAVFSYRRCRVTAGCEPANNGTVEINGESTTAGRTWIFEWGTEVSFRAWVDDDGYEFKGWRTLCGDTLHEADFVIDSIITDTTLTALFPAKTFKVSVRRAQTQYGRVFVGDTALGLTDTVVSYTEPVQIMAVPYESYEFEGWYASAAQDAVRLSDRNPESFNMPKKDTLIYARFRDLRYEVNLTAVPKLGGKLSGAGMYSKPKDPLQSTTVTISARPNSGYKFLGWYSDTVKLWDNLTHSFSLDTNVFLIARFNELPAPLHVRAEPADAVDTLTGARLYYQDYNARVYAEVKEGYQLEYWKNESGEILSSKNPYLFTFNVDDTLLTAVLQAKALEVEFETEPFGGGHADMPVCRYNVPTVAKAVPEYGYGFVCWKYADGTVVKEADGSQAGASITVLSKTDTAFTMVFAPLRYALEIVYDTAAGLIFGADTTYEYMTYAPLRAEPLAHHIFTGWYAADGSLLSTDTALNLRMTADTKVEARFDRKPTFSIMYVEPPLAGYIAENGERIGDTLYHGCGEPLFLEAVAFDGYEFAGWRVVKDGDTNMVWLLSRGLSLKDSSYVTAMFDTVRYEVDVTPEHSSRGTVSGGGSVLHGQSVSLRAVPARGYVFTCYRESLSGRLLSYDADYSFRADSSVDITAVFDTARYKLSVLSADSGAAHTGSGYYCEGDTARLSAWHIDTHKRFAYWSADASGRDTLHIEARFDYPITRCGDDTVYAFYHNADMRLIVKANNSLYGTVKGSGRYVTGTEAVLTAKPSYGYHLESWSENGFPISEYDTLYLPVTSEREIVAVFAPNRYTVKLVAVIEADSQIVVEGVEMHGAGEYDYGTTYYIEMSAVPFGYTFVAWKAEDGNTLSVNSAYSRTAQMSRTIYAVLAKQMFKVTGRVTGDGTVSGGGLYAKGERAVLTAEPRQNWRFMYWRLDGRFYSSSASIELDVYDHLEMEAVFAWDDKQPLPHVAMEGAGGVYMPVGKVSKEAGDRVLLRAIPNDGYEFLYWTYGGDSILSRELDCEVSVSAAPFVTAHFQKSVYQVRMKAVGAIDGALSLSGTGSYRYNDEVSLKVELEDGYKFDGWYRNVEGGFVFVSGRAEVEIRIKESMDLEARISKE